MNLKTLFQPIRGVLLLAVLLQPLLSLADDILPFSELKIPEPSAHFSATQECVEPEDEMKRNHMEYILHQRDKTMHEGVRTRQHSLEECINCHATKDDSGAYIRVEDKRHFCAACHTYAAVKIDCFQCHSDVPVRASNLPKLQSSNTGHHQQGLKQSTQRPETLQLLAAEAKPQ